MTTYDELRQAKTVEEILNLMEMDGTAWSGQRGALAQVMCVVLTTRQLEATVVHLDTAAGTLEKRNRWTGYVAATTGVLALAVAVLALIVTLNN